MVRYLVVQLCIPSLRRFKLSHSECRLSFALSTYLSRRDKMRSDVVVPERQSVRQRQMTIQKSLQEPDKRACTTPTADSQPVGKARKRAPKKKSSKAPRKKSKVRKS